MRQILLASALALGASGASAALITFDDLVRFEETYEEDGFLFTSGAYPFGYSSQQSIHVDDGGDSVDVRFFTVTSDRPFTLLAGDFYGSPYGFYCAPVTSGLPTCELPILHGILVTGTKVDGSTVRRAFAADGGAKITFGREFSNLKSLRFGFNREGYPKATDAPEGYRYRFESPVYHYQVDNLLLVNVPIAAVPVPASLGLGAVALFALGLIRRRSVR